MQDRRRPKVTYPIPVHHTKWTAEQGAKFKAKTASQYEEPLDVVGVGLEGGAGEKGGAGERRRRRSAGSAGSGVSRRTGHSGAAGRDSISVIRASSASIGGRSGLGEVEVEVENRKKTGKDVGPSIENLAIGLLDDPIEEVYEEVEKPSRADPSAYILLLKESTEEIQTALDLSNELMSQVSFDSYLVPKKYEQLKTLVLRNNEIEVYTHYIYTLYIHTIYAHYTTINTQ